MGNDLIQIVEDCGKGNHAGIKATDDVARIADSLGFRRISIRRGSDAESFRGTIVRQLYYLLDWKKAYACVPKNATVLMQHPFHHKQLIRSRTLYRMKKRKHVRFISFVHDVEELRGYRYSDYYQREFREMTELADVLVVHNDVMKGWFIQKGIPEERLISLEIFDYLLDRPDYTRPRFSDRVNIAGNLSLARSGYLAGLGRCGKTAFMLYGPNPDSELCNSPNISYGGNKTPDEIPGCLTEGYGLVWDGDSPEGCKGPAGEYLKYNNPHKLSLFIVSGIPVVIWREAAEAGFVRKHHIGITIDSLLQLPEELDKVDEKEYIQMQAAEEDLRRKMIRGQYGTAAIRKALEYLDTL